MRFEVKKDLWMTVLAWLPMLLALAILLITPFEELTIYLIIIGAIIITLLFMAWVWFFSYYELRDNELYVCFGPIRERIAYEKITMIKETRNFLSSAALSLDRLAIYKNGRLKTLISPLDKTAFLDQIKVFIPHVEIQLKSSI